MKKTVLIMPVRPGEHLAPLENALLRRGFQTVRVVELREALYRLSNDIFSVMICEDDASGTRQKALSKHLALRPFAAVTPVVLLGPKLQPDDRQLLTSVLDQYFPLSTDPETLAEFVEETHSLRAQKAKRGRIGPISVPRLLYQAGAFHLTGAIVVEGTDEKCVVYMENGFMVFASSNRNENRFGEFLLARKLIVADQLRRALELQRTSQKRLGRILVDEGFLKPQLLQTLLQSHIKHIVFNVFDWATGEFNVLFDEAVNPADAITHVHIGPLILEGVQYKFSEARLAAEFEPFQYKVSLALSFSDIQKRVHLGRNERDFLNLVGSGRPMPDLLALNSYSRAESLRLLYAFRILGVLAFERGKVEEVPTMPTNSERSQALSELFSSKSKQEVPREPRQENPEAAEATFRVKWGWGMRAMFVGWATAMVVAISVVTAIYTIFETRTDRDAHSDQSPQVIIVEKNADSSKESTVRVLSVERLPKQTLPAKSEPAILPAATPAPRVALKKTQPTLKPTVQPTITVPARVTRKPTPKPGREFRRLVARARRLREGGKLSSAVAKYEEAFRLKPTSVSIAVELGDSYLEINQPRKAIRVYEKARRLKPSDPRPYLALGMVYQLEGRRGQARKYYKAYLAVVEKTPRSRARIAEVEKILQTLNR